MTLGTVFSSTWQDYKKSFRLVLKTFWWFNVFPAIIFGLIALVLILLSASSPESVSRLFSFSDSLADSGFGWFSGLALVFLILFVVYMVVMIVLNLFLSLTLYFNGLFNKDGKMSFKDVVRGGSKHFWRYLGLIVIMILVFIAVFIPAALIILLTVLTWGSLVLALKIILVLLAIALVILAIIFYIYLAVSWIFSPYILVEGKQGIIDSLKASRALSRRRWWKTFGYILLMGLILYAIAALISIFSFIINFGLSVAIAGVSDLGNMGVYIFLLSVQQIIKYVINLVIAIISTPIFIFYIKNFYLEIKQSQGLKK